MVKKSIRIRLLEHRKSDLLMATSPDLKGLVVHGYSEAEIEEKLPRAVRDVLEADGWKVESVTVQQDEESTVPDFGPPAFIANAALAVGHP